MKRVQDGGLGVSGGERYTVSSTCTHRFGTLASDRINLTGSRGGGGGGPILTAKEARVGLNEERGGQFTKPEEFVDLQDTRWRRRLALLVKSSRTRTACDPEMCPKDRKP
jgi:hypothetical protein